METLSALVYCNGDKILTNEGIVLHELMHTIKIKHVQFIQFVWVKELDHLNKCIFYKYLTKLNLYWVFKYMHFS